MSLLPTQHGPNIGTLPPLLPPASQHNWAKDEKKGSDSNPGGYSVRADLDAWEKVSCRPEPNLMLIQISTYIFVLNTPGRLCKVKQRPKPKQIYPVSRCDRLTRDTSESQSSLVARYINPRGNKYLWIYPQQLQVTLCEVHWQSISQSWPKREPLRIR